MNVDFTVKVYRELLKALRRQGFSFQTVKPFMRDPLGKVVILRHDVDKLAGNALAMARLEHGMGVVATYYFRAVPECWDEGIIREVHELGHEIGYHYENLSEIGKVHRAKSIEELLELAIEDFESSLERFRKIYPVKTICMHGSPLSKYDNKKIWEKYDYRDYGIIAEPYFDVDYDEVFYLTDTGRVWNNWGASVRDKVGIEQRAEVAPAEVGGRPG